MRLAVVGHSNAHVRQQNFWRQLALMGHDVLVVCPERWGALKPEPYKVVYNGERSSAYEIAPLPVVGSDAGTWDMYSFRLVGLDRVLKAWKPDLLYVQQEAACQLTRQVLGIGLDVPMALFVWENIEPCREGVNRDLLGGILDEFSLLVCGNDAAARLHPHRRQVFLPQVGVDVHHFAARPEIERSADVGYIGRAVTEKGIHDLEAAWPSARITPWTEWTKLPWALSGIKTVACPSRDTAYWKEQAGPYAAWEAMSCECGVVVSDAGAIPWWNKGGFCEPCQSLVMVEQGNPDSLRRGLALALNEPQRGKESRQWVEQHLSSLVIAKRLAKELEAVL